MVLPTRPALRRPGLSLLEVLVALAIFLMSFIAIGQLVNLASDSALEVQYQSQAARLAQSKLNEVVAGVVPLQGGGSGSFDEDPDWQWSVESDQNSTITGLWTVTVTVTRPMPGGGDISSSISSMILDPTMRGSVFDQVTVTGVGDTASTVTPSSSSGQGTTTPAGGGGGGAGGAGGGKMGNKPGGGGGMKPGGGGGGGGAKMPAPKQPAAPKSPTSPPAAPKSPANPPAAPKGRGG